MAKLWERSTSSCTRERERERETRARGAMRCGLRKSADARAGDSRVSQAGVRYGCSSAARSASQSLLLCL